MIADNIREIKDNIEKITKRINGKPVTLIAVSKTVDIDRVDEAVTAGQVIFGENRPQELKRKKDYFGARAKFHMIGSLQTNKVKDVIGRAELIHSLDRLSLLEALEKRAASEEKVVSVLIQVNVAKEDSKSGVFVEDLDQFIKQVSECPHIQVEGLMVIAPFAEDPEEIRWVFQKGKEIFESYRKIGYNNIRMKYLSMGMSHDYEVAIEEGSNMVRIGTSIFGKRNYQ